MHQSLCVAVSLLVAVFSAQSAEISTNSPKAFDRPYDGLISVSNGLDWGSWGYRELCPLGTYATGFRIKVDPYEGYFGDDTALNGIALHCSEPRTPSFSVPSYSTVQSSSGSWGQWTENYWCTSGVMQGFQLRADPYGGFWYDDTAANNIRFLCSEDEVLEGNGLSWGTWGHWSPNCPGKGICGIETRVEPAQGVWDDTTLTDVRFYCCN